MRIETHKQYDKAWAKLTRPQQARAMNALKLFTTHPSSPQLRVHQLKGTYYPHYSISVGGDLRIHYLVADSSTVILTMIGTHSQLYK